MSKDTPMKDEQVKQRNRERENNKYEPRKEQVESNVERIKKIIDSIPKDKKST